MRYLSTYPNDLSIYDVVIVGAGLSGAVMAERMAAQGKRILILEQRDHIGGGELF